MPVPSRPVTIGPMVPLTTTTSPVVARVLAAHLGAEGIVWQLRGNVDGPYPVGPIEVLVTAEDVERAREVVAAHLAPDDVAPPPAADDRAPPALWLVLAGVLLVATVLAARLVALGW
jgi:hypothetical protein